MHISGITAIVTGGASGLGRATVELLSKQGAKVAIFDVNDELGTQAANQCGGLYVRVDLTSASDVATAFQRAADQQGPARLLVNCAGISPAATLISEARKDALDKFRRTFEVNVVGSFITMAEFANRIVALPMLGEERGLLINTASIAAYDGQIGHCGYASSKAAVVGLTLPAARELAPYGVRVMTIAPGLFATNMTNSTLAPEVQAALGKQVPFPQRFGTPAEFAMLVQSIVTNPMLNGETIRLHGALSLAALRLDDLLVAPKDSDRN
jgi:NAD(P)-dependent dehydrogenase (short-subunit alcohol dehydrogenase family)